MRLDTGVGEGDEISVFYDPMIAKLVVRGADRASALQLMKRSLAQWETVGLPTNVPFLQRLCENEAFANADVHTAFIEQHAAQLLPEVPPPPPPRHLKLAALYWALRQADTLAASVQTLEAGVWGMYPFARLGGGMCGGTGFSPLQVHPLGFDGAPYGEPIFLALRHAGELDGGSVALEMALAASKEEIAAGVDGLAWSHVSALEWCADEHRFRADVDGDSIHGSATLTTEGPDSLAGVGDVVHLFTEGVQLSVLVSDVAAQARARLSAGAGAGARLRPRSSRRCPTRCTVLVAEGQQVGAGEPLVVLEAMKMEHTMKAPAAATVQGVHAKEGEVVSQRALLLSFAEAEGAAAEAA